ncbi:hypothetical protein Pla123a_11400 [Posidoniimonas polymericola]|uniref:Dockerin domain-containing protein n=1 Tax=Posidoniimonas polymericola TaxID=2528002 RepID=A0A5C5YTM8_9BACT|nr:hypothetical protein [Posidoniimonas polymericola]TWT78349.1 hypothetical protein Pla123a_11400 [Posidoniimonas polymericola]
MKINQMHTTRNLLLTIAVAAASAGVGQAADLQYAGTDYDIGGTFFPGAGPAGDPNRPYVVVPWRTSGAGNQFAAVDEDGERYYGRDGYVVFATRRDYPNANVIPGISSAPGDPNFELLFANQTDLPSWVAGSQVLASRVVGGYGYALIDDPELTQGIRDWSWGEGQSPQSFGQAPYVKLGILDGWDQFGNDPANPDGPPAGRWGFSVGDDAPSHFRLGVMVDGTDNSSFVPDEVFLMQVSSLGGGSILHSSSTLSTDSNRFVDMHFFDISGAEAGDLFAVGVKSKDAGVSFGNAGVAGVTFDVLQAPPVLAGDYNGNGVVDAADYTIWRDNEGLTGVVPGTQGDGNRDGKVAGVDYNIWASNFGNAIALSAPTPAPEPTAGALVALTLLGGAAPRERRG